MPDQGSSGFVGADRNWIATHLEGARQHAQAFQPGVIVLGNVIKTGLADCSGLVLFDEPGIEAGLAIVTQCNHLPLAECGQPACPVEAL
jgi:hypothetical protein